MKKITLIAAAYLSFASAFAQTSGSFDSTFNNVGFRVLPDPTAVTPQVTFKNVLQPDGKIIVAGNRMAGDFNTEIIIWRLHPDGSSDSSFGTNGRTAFHVTDFFNTASGLALRQDGKIVIAGNASDETGINHLFSAVLSEDGELDPSFGSAGTRVYSLNMEDPYITDMTLQTDNKILMTGIIRSSSSPDSSFIFRAGADGLPDVGFSGDGLVGIQQAEEQTNIYAVVQDHNGKIIVGGSYNSEDNYQDFLIMRFNDNGTPDNSFSFDGGFFNDFFQDYDEIHNIEILSDNSIVASGYSYNGNNDGVAVLKLNSSGQLVTTFGDQGRQYTGDNNAAMRGFGMAIQSDGKIVIGGQKSGASGLNDFLLLRLDSAGQPDLQFGNGVGYVTADLNNPGEENNIHSVSIGNDGKIVANGTTIQDVSTQEVLPVVARFISGLEEGPAFIPNQLNSLEFAINIYPNPSSTTTTVTFELEQPENGSLDLYDIAGRKIAEIWAGKSFQMKNEVRFEKGNLPAGIYFIYLKTESINKMAKLIIR